MEVKFCTCDSFDCPNHPTNHDKGCTPCIEKNLVAGEVPSCIFNREDPERKMDRGQYLAADYARIVTELQK